MAAARYWRLVGIETYAGGDLELSALHLYTGGTRADSAATLTSSHAPIAGALGHLKDDDTVTVCRFAGAAVRSGGFALVWDFGAGGTADITALRPGGGGGRANFMAYCTLQYSTDGSTWVLESTRGIYPWPGVNAMTAELAPGDAAYPNVTLLLPMDGADGSTVFTDKSATPKEITAYGNVKLSTAHSNFGGASAYFDGAGDYLAVSGPSGFSFGPQDFTIEWWSLRTATKGDCVVVATSTDGAASGGWYVGFDGANLSMYSAGSAVIVANNVGSAGGVGVFWAITRSGTTVRAFKNGVILATATSSISLPATNARVGGTETFGGYDGWFNGYIDNLRITKGVARYTADYTPPTEPFPHIGGGAVGIVFDAPIPHTSRSGFANAASAPVPAHSTPLAARLQTARDVEFGGPGTIYGTTKTKGAPNTPTKARVVLLHQRSKQPVRETWSDPVTGAFAFPGIDTAQDFLVLVELPSGAFAPLAASRIMPSI